MQYRQWLEYVQSRTAHLPAQLSVLHILKHIFLHIFQNMCSHELRIFQHNVQSHNATIIWYSLPWFHICKCAVIVCTAVWEEAPVWVQQNVEKSVRNIWYTEMCTEWRRPVECLKLQVFFRKRATNYRALLRKMTYGDTASYGSSPPCSHCLYIGNYTADLAICKCAVIVCTGFCEEAPAWI